MLWHFRQLLGDFIKNPMGRQPVRPTSGGGKDLAGDRLVEWSYIAPRIGCYADRSSRVLDFGSGSGMLSYGAATLGASVLAIDLLDQPVTVCSPRLTFRRMDVMDVDEKQSFDVIIHSSVIEHVGLCGRYGSEESGAGDFEAMRKMRRLLHSEGHMVMTLPVGQDVAIQPFHRIYGKKRLPLLLEGYRVVDQQFWRKDEDNLWQECSESQALDEEGNDHYYAIGGMVLQPA
jgi:hypothetical protein